MSVRLRERYARGHHDRAALRRGPIARVDPAAGPADAVSGPPLVHRSGVPRRRAGAVLRAPLGACRPWRRAPGTGRLHHRRGGGGERDRRTSARRGGAGDVERVPPPRRSDPARPRRQLPADDPLPVSLVVLRPRRRTARSAQPARRGRSRPGPARPAAGARPGGPRLRVAEPRPRSRRFRRRDRRAAERAGRRCGSPRRLGARASRERPADQLCGGGQLEADRRELHGVLPLLLDPPGARGRGPGIPRRSRLPGPRGRSRLGAAPGRKRVHRRRPCGAADAPRPW